MLDGEQQQSSQSHTYSIVMESTELTHAIEEGDLGSVHKALMKVQNVNDFCIKECVKTAVFQIGNNAGKIVAALLDHGLTIAPNDGSNRELFHDAIAKGYVPIVLDLLKYGAEVNTEVTLNLYGPTPLHTAARYNRGDVAQILIHHKANVNSKDNWNVTPLYYFARHGNVSLTKLLMANKAEVNDFRILLAAAKSNCLVTFELILEHFSDINRTDKHGWTPFHFLANGYNDACGRVRMAEKLLCKGADINARTSLGKSLLHLAASNRDESLQFVELLLKSRADVNAITKWYYSTPLHYAARRGNYDICVTLLKNGANVHAKAKDENRPFECEGSDYYAKIVQLILEGKADPSAVDGYTPLHYAAKNGHIDICALLLENGALINAKSLDGVTPLDAACEGGHTELVIHFIEFGACESVENAIRIAAINNHPELIEVLLSYEVSRETKATLLVVASEKGYLDIVRMLLDFKDPKDNVCAALYSALFYNRPQIVELLLNYDPSYCTKDFLLLEASHRGFLSIVRVLLRSGMTFDTSILHEALEKSIFSNRPAVVEALLQVLPASYVNTKIEDKQPLLSIAVALGRSIILSIFLKYGADVNLSDEKENTPLHFACNEGHSEIVVELIRNGADVNLLNLEYETALSKCAKKIDPVPLTNFWGNQINEGTDCLGIVNSVEALIRHMAKMKSLNLFVHEENWQVVTKYCWMKKYCSDCETVLATMKSERILMDCDISYYDVLVRKISTVAKYLLNDNIMNRLRGSTWNCTSIYSADLSKQITLSLERIDFLEKANEIVNSIFPGIPFDCCEKILDFLNSGDIKFL